MIRALIVIMIIATVAACTGPQATGTPAPTAAATTAAAGTPTRRPPTPPPVNTALPAPSATPEAPAERGTPVTFPSADGVRLRGAFYAPAGDGPFKTLVLIHGAGSRTDRHIWDAFIPVLQGAGYAVLAYDARGAGLSDRVAPDSATPDSRVFDVTGALNWLDTRPEVDTGHVGIIGASLGANVAYAANGGTTRIRTAVLLSPLNTGEALLGTGVPGFVSRDVLFVCDEPGIPAAQALFDQSRAPRELYTAAPGIRAQGAALLTTPEIVTEILNWLTEQL